MQDAPSYSRKQRFHEEWLSRGAFDECFGSREPPVVFKKWRGNPDPCRCGCGEVRYSTSNPHNLWESLSPNLLWETGFLFPIFRAIYGVLWELSGPVWAAFQAVFSVRAVKDHVIADPLGNKLGRALTPSRFLFWSVFCVVLLLLAAAAWSLPRIGGVVIFPLYLVGMAVFMTIIGLIWGLTAVLMASYSIVFLIGGAASFAFGFNPAIGTLLIVAGVALEYESRRRRDRENREQIGRVLRIIEQKRDNALPDGECQERFGGARL